MSTIVETGTQAETRDEPRFPADGPIEAVLNYWLFYVVVDRATPTVVAVAPSVLPDVSPSLIRTGLAVLLWLVLTVTVIEQVRRQLAALGVARASSVVRGRRTHGTLSGTRAVLYLVVLLLGGLFASLTFDVAIDTAVALLPMLVELDFAAFQPVSFVVMVAFFVAFGVAATSLDRLVFGGIRTLR